MRVLVLALVAPALGLSVLEDAMLASEHAIAPIFFEAVTQDPSPDLTLRDLLEPFEDRLRQPYVKFSQGSGEPADDGAVDWAAFAAATDYQLGSPGVYPSYSSPALFTR